MLKCIYMVNFGWFFLPKAKSFRMNVVSVELNGFLHVLVLFSQNLSRFGGECEKWLGDDWNVDELGVRQARTQTVMRSWPKSVTFELINVNAVTARVPVQKPPAHFANFMIREKWFFMHFMYKSVQNPTENRIKKLRWKSSFLLLTGSVVLRHDSIHWTKVNHVRDERAL